jgi:glycerol uptake facilitator-like aquaporin
MADVTSQPFAGRLGGNQEFILDPKNVDNEQTLKRIPDASPFISLQEIFDLRGFLERKLWKAAATECLGTALLVWLTVFISAHPTGPPPLPSPTSGIYSTPTFLGPLVGGITNIITLTLFIYTLGPVSGGHLNPIITISTFTARLTTFPRMVLYIAFQTLGAVIAGLMMRSTYGSRDFLAGGCSVDTSIVPTKDIFALEFMADLTLLFLAFGVGLDVRTGYGGASMNPARCMGAYVGSRFPEYTWIVWVAPISASIIHGVIYWALPPWTYPKPNQLASAA